MLKKIQDVLRSLGLYPVKISNSVAPYQASDYLQSTNENTGEVHVTFLNKLNEEESGRLTLIEAKTSQLISQTGIIFSLLSLFVPLLIDKVASVPIWIKAILLVLLLLAFCCYVLTINNALKNFKITNFPYSNPSAKNVLNLQDKPVALFYNEVVKDLLDGLQINKKLNNIKATNLLHSYTAFKTANALTACLVSCFCVSILFLKQPDSAITIKGPVKIEHFDSTLSKLIQVLDKRKTVVITKPDSLRKITKPTTKQH